MSLNTTASITGLTINSASSTITGFSSGSTIVLGHPSMMPHMDHLEAEQMLKVEDLLKTSGKSLTNFEIQRTLFNGNLNKEAALAIKRHLLQLVEQKKVEATGNKRGRRYLWIG